MRKIFQFGLRHKITAGAIIFIIAAGGYSSYRFFSSNKTNRYIFAKAEKGTLVVSLSGNGQISAFNQTDIKPKVSGDVVYLNVKNSETVKTGTLIAQLDAAVAQKAVRDAETNLASAKLSLEKLKKPADILSLLQTENALAQAEEAKQKAADDLKKSYEDGFNGIANVFLDLPGIMTGLEDMMFDNTIDPNSGGGDNITWYINQVDHQPNVRDKAVRYRNDVYDAYAKTRKQYAENFENYKITNRLASAATMEVLLLQTYETAKIVSDTIKTIDNYIDFVQDDLESRDVRISTQVSIHQQNVNTFTGKINSHLSNLLVVKRALEDSKNATLNADRSIAEKKEALIKLKTGTDAFDIQTAELTVRQRENSLLDAGEKLADYYIRAPFAGIIAKVNVKKTDSVSPADVIAILVTPQKIAEISLNEIDVTKIEIGQKAILTFDAVPDFTLTGRVAEIDIIGTVSQGVVTYNIKIGFDTQDERIKPGMSVSAAIIIETKTNVLLVPNSAIKSRGHSQYVELPDQTDLSAAAAAIGAAAVKNPLRSQIIKIGSANDELTEVLNGLKEGDLVVTRTISSDSKISSPTIFNQTPSQQRIIRIPGLPGAGGSFRNSPR